MEQWFNYEGSFVSGLSLSVLPLLSSRGQRTLDCEVIEELGLISTLLTPSHCNPEGALMNCAPEFEGFLTLLF